MSDKIHEHDDLIWDLRRQVRDLKADIRRDQVWRSLAGVIALLVLMGWMRSDRNESVYISRDSDSATARLDTHGLTLDDGDSRANLIVSGVPSLQLDNGVYRYEITIDDKGNLIAAGSGPSENELFSTIVRAEK